MSLDGLNTLAEGMGKLLETAPRLYDDAIKPIVQPTAKTISLIPRAINAALSGLENWIMGKEYNKAEVQKLLVIELEDIPPEKIVTPEPYIGVPVILAISYCINSEALRTLYSKLLAKSMNVDTKDNVLPCYVEIIKQLSPKDAAILQKIDADRSYPICNIRYQEQVEISDSYFSYIQKGVDIHVNYAVISGVDYDYPTISISLANLQRVGVIDIDFQKYIFDEHCYLPCVENAYFRELLNRDYSYEGVDALKNPAIKLEKGLFTPTLIGREFIRICVN